LIKLVIAILLKAEADIELGVPMRETTGDAVNDMAYVDKLC
jgi:hypothetical protein